MTTRPTTEDQSPSLSSDARHSLDAVRLSAWRHVSRSRDLVHQALAARLASVADLPVEWYDVLLHLREQGNGQMRQTELEGRLPVGASGVSRLLGRMEERGLITRRPSEDRRARIVLITEHGTDTLVRATPVYMEGVQEAFGAHLENAEASTISCALARVVYPKAGQATERDYAHLVPFGETVLSLTAGAVAAADATLVRNELEPALLVDATRNRTDESVQEMRRAVDEMAGQLGNPEAFFRADWNLHRIIAGQCRNTTLRTLYLSLLDVVESHFEHVEATKNLAGYLQRRLVVHARLADAVASGDTEAARKAAAEHHFTSVAPHLTNDM